MANSYDDDTDDDTKKKNVQLPTCFHNCVKCKKPNQNAHFQYCHACFIYRMKFDENIHEEKPKSVQRLADLLLKKEYESLKTSQGTSNSEQPVSGLYSSPEENNDDLCNICLIMPKNAVFNHGKTGHRYCCYFCAKRIRRKTHKCPICNARVKQITRIIEN